MRSMARLVLSFYMLLIGCWVCSCHVLDCDFSDGFCGWSNAEGQPQDWEIELGEEGIQNFLKFKPSWGSNDDVVITLQSPMLPTPPTADFRFNYWTVINGEGTLRVRLAFYSEDKTLTEETTVFEQQKSSGGKEDVEITFTIEGGPFFRISIDAVVRDGFFGVFHLSDLTFKTGCDSTWCHNGGTCSDNEDGTHQCLCSSGFEGERCGKGSSKLTFCSDLELSMKSRPESLSTYVAGEKFEVKCTVNTALLFSTSGEDGVCANAEQNNTMTSVFRAVTSVVVKKEDKVSGWKQPIAMVSCVDPPISFQNEENIMIQGSVKATEKLINGDVLAFLNVAWSDPDQSQTGVYSCHMTGFDTLGQSVEGEVRVEVIEQQDTLESLRAQIAALNVKLTELGARILELEKENKVLQTNLQLCQERK